MSKKNFFLNKYGIFLRAHNFNGITFFVLKAIFF